MPILVLIFGVETWVVTPLMVRVLGRFQDQVAQSLMGRLPRLKTDGKWEYNLEATAREEVGFKIMEEYIRKRNNTAAN